MVVKNENYFSTRFTSQRNDFTGGFNFPVNFYSHTKNCMKLTQNYHRRFYSVGFTHKYHCNKKKKRCFSLFTPVILMEIKMENSEHRGCVAFYFKTKHKKNKPHHCHYSILM